MTETGHEQAIWWTVTSRRYATQSGRSIEHKIGILSTKFRRDLFRGRMPERDLAAIREATNKAWVLGDERFKAQIEAKTGRRAVPLGWGQEVSSVREVKNQ